MPPMSCATYHQNCRYNGSNYELSSCQMLKYTHTTRNIFRSKHHTNRSDLTPQFHLLDPTMVYKHRDCYVQCVRGTYTRCHLVADDRSTRRHLATVLVDMWSRVQEWSRGCGLTWNENIQLININNFNIG